jgi:hypothetical protein
MRACCRDHFGIVSIEMNADISPQETPYQLNADCLFYFWWIPWTMSFDDALFAVIGMGTAISVLGLFLVLRVRADTKRSARRLERDE